VGTPLFVGIGGGTCSGKTTLMNRLCDTWGDALAVVAFDDLAIGPAALAAAGITVTDWDDPGRWRWDDLRGHLADLRAGRPTVIDAQSRESRAAGVTHRRVEPRPVVALVGYLAFHDPTIAAGLDVRVFLDLPEDEMVRRRLSRPEAPFNREPYVSTTLLAAHRRLVLPQRARATHVVDARQPPDAMARIVSAIIRRRAGRTAAARPHRGITGNA
jgi:uridine kinase